jgi:hypothetical protein
VDNPLSVTVTRGGTSQVRSFSYDVNDRLQGVCYVDGQVGSACTQATAAQWWTYDPSGNRTKEETVSSKGGATPSTTTTTSAYDLADRLTGTQANGGPVSPAVTDPDGNTPLKARRLA